LPHIWAKSGVLNGGMNGVTACFAAYQAELQAAPDVLPEVYGAHKKLPQVIETAPISISINRF